MWVAITELGKKIPILNDSGFLTNFINVRQKKEKKKERLNLQGSWAQEFIIYLYIGPVAQAENKGLFEEKKSSSEEIVLVNKEVSFGHNGSRGWVEDKCILG